MEYNLIQEKTSNNRNGQEDINAVYRSHMEHCISLSKIPLDKEKHRCGIRRPYVGAIVLDRDGDKVSEGYKTFVSGTYLLVHAERMALDSLSAQGKSKTLITTLRPCMSVHQRQIFSSCSDLLLQKGIKKVIFGLRDNVSFNAEQGINYLRNRGVEVIELPEFADRIRAELMSREV